MNEARAELQRRPEEVARATQEAEGEHAEVADAVNGTNERLPKSRAKTPGGGDDQQQSLLGLAADLGKSDPAEQKAYAAERKDKAIVIESVAYPGQSFLDVQHVNQQVIVRINTRHRFYKELYGPIRAISEQEPGTVSGVEAVQTACQTRVAPTVLLMAFAKAESMDGDPHQRYGDLHLRSYWGAFLDSMMGDVKELV